MYFHSLSTKILPDPAFVYVYHVWNGCKCFININYGSIKFKNEHTSY